MQKTKEKNIHLDWTTSIFSKQKISSFLDLSKYIEITPYVEQELLSQFDISFFLWKRTLKFYNYLHLPDIFVDPYTRGIFWPSSSTLFEQNKAKGYIPLSPGDLVQYTVFYCSLLSHQAIYVGQGYIIELVRIRESKKPLGNIVIRKLSEMFVKGGTKSKIDFISYEKQQNLQVSRLEVLRRSFSSIGYYQYNIINFNCLTAIVEFYKPSSDLMLKGKNLNHLSNSNECRGEIINAVFYTATFIILLIIVMTIFLGRMCFLFIKKNYMAYVEERENKKDSQLIKYKILK